MFPAIATACVMVALLTSKCSATTNTQPYITSTSPASETTPTSTTSSTSALSLAAQIGVPLLTLLGIAATTAVACFKHFRGKWKIRRRVREARNRRAQNRPSSDQGQDSNAQQNNSQDSDSGSGV